MLNIRPYKVLVIIALLTICASCSSGPEGTAANGAAVITSNADSAAEQAPQQTAAPQARTDFSFPAPSQLPVAAEPRRASYTEASLMREGYGYETGLPHQNFTELSSSGEFAATPGSGLSGAAYALFKFTVDGYDRLPQLRYRWHVNPEPIGAAWIGLANFAENRWDWWQCDAFGWFSFGDITAYTRPADDAMIAAVVVVGDTTCELRYLRLGHPGITAGLTAVPSTGVAPLASSLNGGGSSAAIGTIDSFAWDFDGNGTVDEAGPEESRSHTYEAGTYGPRLFVESSHGETDSETVNVTAHAPFVHSWGGAENDRFYSVDSDGEALYAAGSTRSFTNNDETAVLLVKYALDGTLEWARAWSGLVADAAYGLVASPDAGIFTVGECRSFGAGGSDVLIQHWDPDGNLLWTRTWGKAGSDYALAADIDNGTLYVGGTSTSFFDSNGDSLLLALDLGGNVLWARCFGHPTNPDAVQDVNAWSPLFSASTTVYALHNSEIGDNHVMVLSEYSDDGNPGAEVYWLSSLSSFGSDLSVSGLFSPIIYACGYMYDGASYYGTLLEFAADSPLIVRWDWDGYTRARGVDLHNGSFYISGTKGAANDDGFLIQLSDTGSLEQASIWSDGGGDQDFYGMARFPGSGLVLCGSAESAAGDWQQIATTPQAVPEDWKAWAPYAYPPVDPQFGSPVQAADQITDGVEDVPASETSYESFICTVAQ